MRAWQTQLISSKCRIAYLGWDAMTSGSALRSGLEWVDEFCNAEPLLSLVLCSLPGVTAALASERYTIVLVRGGQPYCRAEHADPPALKMAATCRDGFDCSRWNV